MKIHHLKTERAIRARERHKADPIEVVKIALDQMQNEPNKPTMAVIVFAGLEDSDEDYLVVQSGGGRPREIRSLLHDALVVYGRNLL